MAANDGDSGVDDVDNDDAVACCDDMDDGDGAMAEEDHEDEGAAWCLHDYYFFETDTSSMVVPLPPHDDSLGGRRHEQS